MNKKDYNLALIERFPELIKAYHSEVDWQEGDETGCHVVYADVLLKYMERLTDARDMRKLGQIFDFLEELLQEKDLYFDEVVSFSILEGYADAGENPKLLMPLMGERTRSLLQELLDFSKEMHK